MFDIGWSLYSSGYATRGSRINIFSVPLYLTETAEPATPDRMIVAEEDMDPVAQRIAGLQKRLDIELRVGTFTLLWNLLVW